MLNASNLLNRLRINLINRTISLLYVINYKGGMISFHLTPPLKDLRLFQIDRDGYPVH